MANSFNDVMSSILSDKNQEGSVSDTGMSDEIDRILAEASAEDSSSQSPSIDEILAASEREDLKQKGWGKAGEMLAGVGSMAGSMISGAVQQPIQGVLGLGNLLSSVPDIAAEYAREGGNPEQVKAKALEEAASISQTPLYDYRVENPYARRMMEELQKIGGPIARTIDVAGEKVSSATGSPLLGAATRTAIEFMPGAKQFSKVVPASGIYKGKAFSPREVKQVKKEANKLLDDLNIGKKSTPAMRATEIAQLAERKINNQQFTGEKLKDVAKAARNADSELRTVARSLYGQASAKQAAIPGSAYPNFTSQLDKFISDANLDLSLLPSLRSEVSRLKNLEKRVSVGGMRSFYRDVPMNGPDGLVLARRSLGKSWAKASDAQEKMALGKTKDLLDSFVQQMHDTNLMYGDKSVVKDYKRANAFWKEYADLFREDRVIRQVLEDRNATSKELKNWILGSAKSGYSDGSARVANLFHKITHSPTQEALRKSGFSDAEASNILNNQQNTYGLRPEAFQSLRGEVLFDLLDPILDPVNPRLNEFSQLYEALNKNNRELMSSIFRDPKDIAELDKLNRYAKASVRASRSMAGVKIVDDKNVIDGLSTLVGGHELAQQSLIKRITGSTINFIWRGGYDVQDRRALLGELMGVHFDAPYANMWPEVINLSNMSKSATLTNVMERARQMEEEKDRQILQPLRLPQSSFGAPPPGGFSGGVPSSRGVPNLSPPSGEKGAAPAAPAAQAAPAAPTAQGGNPQSSRMMLEQLFPNDPLLAGLTPPPSPAPAPSPEEEQAPAA